MNLINFEVKYQAQVKEKEKQQTKHHKDIINWVAIKDALKEKKL
jgi:hypothetical protein